MKTTDKGWTMLAAVKNQMDGMRAQRVLGKSCHRAALAEVPASLYDYWRRTAHLEFAGIPAGRLFFASALEGLLDFFNCIRDSGRPCGLPSAAADSVWHAWAARAPASLERFCLKHFGQAIPHVEEAAMRPQMDAALANCMVHARSLERRDPLTPSVPRLFALDRKLRMPRGYAYALFKGEVAVQRLDAQGMPHGARRYQNGLDAVQLLAAGLITQQAYAAYDRQHASAGGACGGGGASSSSSSSDCGGTACDSAGGDGGGDGGGGCGSGCGGGGCGS